MKRYCIFKKRCMPIYSGLFLLIHLIGISSAQNKSFVTVSTVKARFLGMGGASVSLVDDLAALDGNPAGFRVSQSDDWDFVLFNNYIALSSYLAEYRKANDFLEPLGFVFKGISLSKGRFSGGILLGEESLSDLSRINRKKIIDFEGYSTQRNNSFGFSFVLAPRVSFGFATELLIRGSENRYEYAWGYRYGLIVKPKEKISVGICYFDLPEEYHATRRHLDRFCDESLNVGVSCKPVEQLRLAVDVRNVSDEGRGTTREPHVGVEWLPFQHMAVRTGCYFPRDDVAHYSAGFSLFDSNVMKSTSNQFKHSTFALNAAILWQEDETLETGVFILGGLIRF